MNAMIFVFALSSPSIEEKLDRMEREALLPVLHSYWKSMGVLEDGEFVFQNVWAMEADIREMQNRLFDTPADAPPLNAHLLLPGARALDRYIEANEFISYLERRREWLLTGDEQSELDQVLEDAQRRRDIWGRVWRCTGQYTGTVGRRMEMHELRKLVGEDVFYGRAAWPSQLPLAAEKDLDWRNP